MPVKRSGWSLVQVKGFGINRSEIFTRKGYSPSVQFPRILGIECVGEIVESDQYAAGTKVISLMGEMGRAFDGSYAEYVLLPDNQVYPVKTQLSWQNLAAVPETYYTAFGAMRNLQINSSDVILVRAASSAMGIAFVRLLRAKYPELAIDGSTQNPTKKDWLKNHGYSDVIIEQKGILQTERTYTKILELVGPKTIKDSINHLDEFGIICSVGQLGEQWYLEEFDPIIDLQNNVYLITFYSGNVTSEQLQTMLMYIEKYRVSVEPHKVFRLTEIQDAHRYIEEGYAVGKVVVIND